MASAKLIMLVRMCLPRCMVYQYTWAEDSITFNIKVCRVFRLRSYQWEYNNITTTNGPLISYSKHHSSSWRCLRKGTKGKDERVRPHPIPILRYAFVGFFVSSAGSQSQLRSSQWDMSSNWRLRTRPQRNERSQRLQTRPQRNERSQKRQTTRPAYSQPIRMTSPSLWHLGLKSH